MLAFRYQMEGPPEAQTPAWTAMGQRMRSGRWAGARPRGHFQAGQPRGPGKGKAITSPHEPGPLKGGGPQQAPGLGTSEGKESWGTSREERRCMGGQCR